MAASQLVDLVKVNVLNTGTGALTLGTAVGGYRGIETLQNGATYSYSIQQGETFEVGKGMYLAAGHQFIRSPLYSSSGNAAINLQPNAQLAPVALSDDILARDVLQPLYGYGAPLSGQGLPGQTYFDLNNPVTLYGPKTGSGWGVGVSLQGNAGLNGQTVSDLAGLKAVAIVSVTPPTNFSGTWYFWTAGNFSGQADDLNIVKADGVSLATGAWVRQRVGQVSFQASATAKIRNATDKILDYPVTPIDAKCVGDGTADDTANLQAYFNIAGLPAAWLGDGKTFRTTDTITIPAGLPILPTTSKILYAGPADRPAFVIGSAGVVNQAPLSLPYTTSTSTNFTNDAFVAFVIYNYQRTRIRAGTIYNFTTLIELVAKNGAATGADAEILFPGNCKYAYTTTCDGTGSVDVYCNGNYLRLGDATVVTPQAGNYYAWRARNINNSPFNQTGNELFLNNFQPADGSNGEYRCAALFDGTGAYNKIYINRYETGRGPVARCLGPVTAGSKSSAIVMTGNEVIIGMLADSATVLPYIEQTGSARVNLVHYPRNSLLQPASVSLSAIHKKVKGYSPTMIMAVGGMHLTDGTGEPKTAVAPGTAEGELSAFQMVGVDISAGYFVDCEGGDSFTISAVCEPGFDGLLAAVAYDASGARLGVTANEAPDIISDTTSQFNRWTSNMGGCYQSARAKSWSFTVSARTRRIRVFFQDGKPKTLTVHRLNESAASLNMDSGLIGSDVHYCSASPIGSGSGVYGRADLALLDTATGAGFDAYQLTMGGYDAKAWAGSTTYPVGRLRTNDSGKVYQATAAGTSASSGGPTGTGSAIVDGSVTWKYVSPLAAATMV